MADSHSGESFSRLLDRWRSGDLLARDALVERLMPEIRHQAFHQRITRQDRKSTRLNSSHP